MTVTTVYTAVDGKEFHSEEACKKYEAGLKRKEILRVNNPFNNYEYFIVKKDNTDLLYIEHWTGNYREGGCSFNGTLKEYLRKQF